MFFGTKKKKRKIMNQYFKPANAYMFWDWLSSIDFTESVFIKLYLMKIIKFYVKRYPDIVKQTINDHRDEL